MYYTADGGLVKWTQRTSRYDVQDLAVESADVAYVANFDNDEVSKTTNGGFTWGADKDTTAGGGTSHSLALIAEDKLVFGTNDGYVAYSADGNDSWTKISKQLEEEGDTQVTATGLADGDFIFAATSAANSEIERWEIGSSTSWKNMSATLANYYGLVFDASADGVLYGVNADGTDSSVVRNISYSSGTPSSAHWTTVNETGVDFQRLPSALKVALNSDGNPETWLINMEGSTDDLYAQTDVLLAGTPLTLTTPTAGDLVSINPVTGKAQDVLFTWARPATGSYTYELRVCLNDGCSEVVQTYEVASSDSATKRVLMGPNQEGDQLVTFNPGQRYWGQVRTTAPWISPWSATVPFDIEPLQASVPTVLAPENGTLAASARPAFSWAPVAGATNYQFQLALNPFMTAPTVDVELASTGYRLLAELDEGNTYYWRVKATAPVEGEWSAVANFSVAEEEVVAEVAPPVVIEQLPPPQITLPAPQITVPAPQEIVIPSPVVLPQPIAPIYIWAIIIIGAVLVIAVVILIVRTRRSV